MDICIEDNAVYLICSEKISVFEEYYIKCPYEVLFSKLKDNSTTIVKMGCKKDWSDSIFFVTGLVLLDTNYIVSLAFEKIMKTFSDGELIKICLEVVTDIYLPDQNEAI